MHKPRIDVIHGAQMRQQLFIAVFLRKIREWAAHQRPAEPLVRIPRIDNHAPGVAPVVGLRISGIFTVRTIQVFSSQFHLPRAVRVHEPAGNDELLLELWYALGFK